MNCVQSYGRKIFRHITNVTPPSRRLLRLRFVILRREEVLQKRRRLSAATCRADLLGGSVCKCRIELILADRQQPVRLILTLILILMPCVDIFA